MRCEKGATAIKRRWKRIFAGLLAALMLCLCPCFAGAAPPEDLPAVKTFRYATTGMCIEEFNRYQIKETARGRFAWIELHNDDHYVLPLTDEDMASLSALVQELGLAEWNGYHKIDRDVLDGASFSLSVEFEDGGVIDASGSNCFPRGYSEKASAIRDFFEKLMEEYGFELNDLWL